MTDIKIARATINDIGAVASLYRAVAAHEGGLVRVESEITDAYVKHFITRSVETGIILVARPEGADTIIGEIHAFALGPKAFSHLLGELTIAVHPDFQGIGAGTALFSEFMRQVKDDRADIRRVELIARESNAEAIAFYEKIGFKIEGKLEKRISSVGGGFESDIPMAWLP